MKKLKSPKSTEKKKLKTSLSIKKSVTNNNKNNKTPSKELKKKEESREVPNDLFKNTPLDTQIVSKAVFTILDNQDKLQKKSNNKKKVLFGETKKINLSVLFNEKFSQKTLDPKPIELEHALTSEQPRICLIVRKPQKFYKEKLKKAGLFEKFSKVLDLDHLKKKLYTFEEEKKWIQNFDLIVAEKIIFKSTISKFRQIHKKSKLFPISLKTPTAWSNNTPSGLIKKINGIIKSTRWQPADSNSTTIVVGNNQLNGIQIIENIAKILPQITQFLPQKWDSILSISLHFEQSISIPIYRAENYWKEEKVSKTPEKITLEKLPSKLEKLMSKDFWETQELADSVRDYLKENFDEDELDELIETDDEELTEVAIRTSKRRKTEKQDDSDENDSDDESEERENEIDENNSDDESEERENEIDESDSDDESEEDDSEESDSEVDSEESESEEESN